MELTDFQRSCEVALTAALALAGRSLERSVVPPRELRAARGFGWKVCAFVFGQRSGNKREIYVTGKISGSLVTVFIYEDGAQLIVPGKRERRYERYDFKSLQELQDRFVAEVIGTLESLL